MDRENDSERIDRFELGMEILSRIETELAGTPQTISEPFYFNSDWKLGPDNQSEGLLDLQTLIDSLQPLPPQTLLIGQCDDGLPVLVELTKPDAGSILVIGDPGSGKTSLLRSILTSATWINTPRSVRFACISQNLLEFERPLASAHCYRTAAPYDDDAADIIRELCEIASQRMVGKQLGASIVLAIDDLASLIETLDEETFYLLLWLIQNGPVSQVWTIGSIDSTRGSKVDPNLYGYFNTFLIGHTSSASQNDIPAHILAPQSETIISGVQFSVKFENEWVNFWVPKA